MITCDELSTAKVLNKLTLSGPKNKPYMIIDVIIVTT
jgi:hypothetical protein